MALRGAVDLNEEIGLDALGERQSVLLDAWGASGGELSDSLIGAIEATDFSGLASVFDNQMRVRRIGPSVGLWNAQQRIEAVGRDMGELPAPAPYLQAVRESLEASIGQGIALHHRIKVRVGEVSKTYRRLALPCTRTGVILSVSMLEAA